MKIKLILFSSILLAGCASFNADRSTVREDSVDVPQLRGTVFLGDITSKSSDISSSEFRRTLHQSLRGQNIINRSLDAARYQLDAMYIKSYTSQDESIGTEAIVLMTYTLLNKNTDDILLSNYIESKCFVETTTTDNFVVIDKLWSAIGGVSDKLPNLLTSIKPIEREKSSFEEDSIEKDKSLGYPNDGTFVSSNNHDERLTLSSECSLRRGIVQMIGEINSYHIDNN